MSSKDTNDVLSKLVDNFLSKVGDENPLDLVNYLLNNGKKEGSFNLDLARNFLHILEKHSKKDMNSAWKLALKLAQFPFEKIPDESKENYDFIIFLGTWSLGLIAGLNPAYLELATPIIQSLANDPKTKKAIKQAKKGINRAIANTKEEKEKVLLKTKEIIDRLSFQEKIEDKTNKFISRFKKKEQKK
ncbi:MAG: hypothetical protein ACTSPJ_09750 [Candidatus Heimdallarchaeaceae archaeon]